MIFSTGWSFYPVLKWFRRLSKLDPKLKWLHANFITGLKLTGTKVQGRIVVFLVVRARLLPYLMNPLALLC